MTDSLSLEDVQAFCRRRETDLVVRAAKPPYTLELHGEFDGYGDFFTIHLGDIAYLELPASLTVGSMALTTDASTITPKWGHVPALYPGQALVLCAEAAGGLSAAPPETLFLVVAEEIHLRRGRDWSIG